MKLELTNFTEQYVNFTAYDHESITFAEGIYGIPQII